ncbi:methyltransferase [Amycolatopsis rhabdoformis]|uniref:Methyltransferase n=2 Tax=Amycolatopsis rhabdoformis TaxID=1448059 RepID=A0ABZ1I208_9PSEU|nr:methyltransferase [Amycolatopsis rhabdoformis]WSE28417.1 methyltransferase [Amycolatopsis rhabdoformis]
MTDPNSLSRLAGLATPMALRVAVTLGLPARLYEDASADALAAELHVDPVALGLLLDHLTTLGIFDRTPTGYRTTAYGELLRDDFTATLLDLTTAGGRAELAFIELAHSITTGEAAYPRRYGQDFWADLASNARLRESFDRQMTLRLNEQIPQLVAGFDWSRFPEIVDVGGGRGDVLAAILTAHPTLRGHLLDLPPTAADARRTFAAHGLDERTEVTAGSFFDPLPPGADAYVLVDILHDWPDPQAHHILARCADALAPTSRVLVVEPLADHGANTESALAMLTIFGGRERTLDELRTLASAHGLILEAVTDVTAQRTLLEFRR